MPVIICIQCGDRATVFTIHSDICSECRRGNITDLMETNEQNYMLANAGRHNEIVTSLNHRIEELTTELTAMINNLNRYCPCGRAYTITSKYYAKHIINCDEYHKYHSERMEE